MANRARARELVAEFYRKGDPLGWFEALYREAEAGAAEVPWADLRSNANLLDFWRLRPQETHERQRSSLEAAWETTRSNWLTWGFQTTAFDVAPTAISAARKRFPTSSVDYAVATCSLLRMPGDESSISCWRFTRCKCCPPRLGGKRWAESRNSCGLMEHCS